MNFLGELAGAVLIALGLILFVGWWLGKGEE